MATTGKKISAMDTIDADALTAADMMLVLDTGADLKKLDVDNVMDAITTPFTRTMVDDLTAGATLTTLGFSAFGQTLVDDADLATLLNTLGLDADLATFALPASAVISAFGKSMLDDTTQYALHQTLGLDTPESYAATWLDKASAASGTTVELATAPPTGVTRVTIIFQGISSNTNDRSLQVQCSVASAWVTAAYVGISAQFGSGAGLEESHVDSFQCAPDTYQDAADSLFGFFNMYRKGSTDHWFATGQFRAGTTDHYHIAFNKVFAGVIDGIRLNINGATFDGTGAIQAIYSYGVTP